MFIQHLSFSISIAFISWIAGMLLHVFLMKTTFYKNQLSRLDCIPNNKWNKYLGLNFFKWIIRNTFFKFFNPDLKLKSKVTQENLEILRQKMTKSEIDHLIAFLLMLAIAIQKLCVQQYSFAITIFIVNIFMNLYPSRLQQENKRRIDLLLVRFNQN